MLNLRVLYRGPLSSCNYACTYCPFAKWQESLAELEPDRLALQRFQDWIEREQQVGFRILFTPWGEALVRPWYQSALVTLSHLANVSCVAIQTNLSCNLPWVLDANPKKLAFWATYHPTETDRKFVNKVRFLHDHGIRISVGVVGLKEHFEEIEWLSQELPPDVYCWVNAYKREAEYYDAREIDFLTRIDQFFPINNVYHASLGQSCTAGETSITVDGSGDIRRCHFVKTPIGNIHDPDWHRCLQRRPCPNESCGCYIGYHNLEKLNLVQYFGDGLLERIPLTTAR